MTDYCCTLFKDSVIVESCIEIYTKDADAFGTSRKETTKVQVKIMHFFQFSFAVVFGLLVFYSGKFLAD